MTGWTSISEPYAEEWKMPASIDSTAAYDISGGLKPFFTRKASRRASRTAPQPKIRVREPGPAQASLLRVALPGQQRNRVRASLPSGRAIEDQLPGDGLSRVQHAVGQEGADIGLAAFRGPASVQQPDVRWQPADNHEQVGVDDVLARVG